MKNAAIVIGAGVLGENLQMSKVISSNSQTPPPEQREKSRRLSWAGTTKAAFLHQPSDQYRHIFYIHDEALGANKQGVNITTNNFFSSEDDDGSEQNDKTAFKTTQHMSLGRRGGTAQTERPQSPETNRKNQSEYLDRKGNPFRPSLDDHPLLSPPIPLDDGSPPTEVIVAL